MLARGGGHCGEECAPGVGGVALWRRLPPESARKLNLLTLTLLTKASTGKNTKKEPATSRQAAVKNHQCTARVDVKRVGPAPGEPDQLKGKQSFPTNE